MIPWLYVVVVGTLFGNKTIHGPFDNEQAKMWAAVNAANQPYEIVRIER